MTDPRIVRAEVSGAVLVLLCIGVSLWVFAVTRNYRADFVRAHREACIRALAFHDFIASDAQLRRAEGDANISAYWRVLAIRAATGCVPAP